MSKVLFSSGGNILLRGGTPQVQVIPSGSTADDCVCCGPPACICYDPENPNCNSPVATQRPPGGFIISGLSDTITWSHEKTIEHIYISSGASICCVRYSTVNRVEYTISGLSALNGTYPSAVIRPGLNDRYGPCETNTSIDDFNTTGCGTPSTDGYADNGCEHVVFVKEGLITCDWTASRTTTILQSAGLNCAVAEAEVLDADGTQTNTYKGGAYVFASPVFFPTTPSVQTQLVMNMDFVSSVGSVPAVTFPSCIKGTLGAGCVDPGDPGLFRNPWGFGAQFTWSDLDYLTPGFASPSPPCDFAEAPGCYPRYLSIFGLDEWTCQLDPGWPGAQIPLSCPSYSHSGSGSTTYIPGTYPGCENQGISTDRLESYTYQGSGISCSTTYYEA